mgnify:CR=1 FL=1
MPFSAMERSGFLSTIQEITVSATPPAAAARQVVTSTREVAAGLAEPHHTEPGAAGPTRTLHRPSRTGRRAADAWLDRPVTRVRDLRMEFLAKLRLNQRRNRDLSHLVDAQRSALAGTFERLEAPSSTDVVDLWRSHNADAAKAFLDELSQR